VSPTADANGQLTLPCTPQPGQVLVIVGGNGHFAGGQRDSDAGLHPHVHPDLHLDVDPDSAG
jgi:hypothetical protein